MVGVLFCMCNILYGSMQKASITKMAKVQAVAPGPVQCKGFLNTLHYQCNSHHGLFLNAFEGFLPEDTIFFGCWSGCCAVLPAAAPAH